MQTLTLLTLIALTLAAAVYAHVRLPFHTPDRRQLRTARIVLLATGAGFGWVMARIYSVVTDLSPVLVFIAAMCLVHVPAAAVLFVKHQRADQRADE